MATELSQDLVIPAYTDTELTVKKVEKGVTGIDFGTVIINNATEIVIEHNLKKVPSFISATNGNFNNVAIIETTGSSLRAIYENNYILKSFALTNVQITDKLIRGSIDTNRYTAKFNGTYRWFAIA